MAVIFRVLLQYIGTISIATEKKLPSFILVSGLFQKRINVSEQLIFEILKTSLFAFSK
jgi:hypothetical protein